MHVFGIVVQRGKSTREAVNCCDNVECGIGWFQVECKSLKKKPEDDEWFCSESCRLVDLAYKTRLQILEESALQEETLQLSEMLHAGVEDIEECLFELPDDE